MKKFRYKIPLVAKPDWLVGRVLCEKGMLPVLSSGLTIALVCRATDDPAAACGTIIKLSPPLHLLTSFLDSWLLEHKY